MKKGIIISVILFLTLAGIAFSRGWYGEGNIGLYPIVWLSLKYKEKIGLDQEQISALEKIQAYYREEAEAQYGIIRTLREKLETNVAQNNFAEAEEIIKDIGAIRTYLLIKRLEVFRKAKTEILAPYQYNKLTERIQRKRSS